MSVLHTLFMFALGAFALLGLATALVILMCLFAAWSQATPNKEDDRMRDVNF